MERVTGGEVLVEVKKPGRDVGLRVVVGVAAVFAAELKGMGAADLGQAAGDAVVVVAVDNHAAGALAAEHVGVVIAGHNRHGEVAEGNLAVQGSRPAKGGHIETQSLGRAVVGEPRVVGAQVQDGGGRKHV